MKKTIAILAVLVIALACVFADVTSETHKLTVQTTVSLVLPSFSFSAKNNNVIVATNAQSAKFDTSESTDPDFSGNATLVLANTDISNAAISQQFDIISKTVANYNGSFDLTVAATAFKGTDDNDTTYETVGDIAYVYAKLTPDASNHITTNAVAAEKITVTYKGKQVATDVGLGNVTITWPQDTAAIPATYTADVTLTVTAL